MPSPYHHAKSKLIGELWLPLAQDGGDLLFPSRKKHKRMRLFTLTDLNYHEIKIFEDKKLTKREDVVAWTYSQQQAYRLETELGRSKIICEGRLDDGIGEDGRAVSDVFPCEILNLDFLSQNPTINSNGRIERELCSAQVLVKLLGQLNSKGLILFYTTILNGCNLEINNLKFSFPLTLEGIPNFADNLDKKIGFISGTFSSVVRNYNFSLVNMNHATLDIENSPNKIFSLGILAYRSN